MASSIFGFTAISPPLAEVHAYGALENGLRIWAERANAHPKRKGMQAYMENACEHGWLLELEWDVPGALNFLDVVVMMRNNIDNLFSSCSRFLSKVSGSARKS